MKILNLMLSKGEGGIENAFLDYSAALRSQGYDVTNIISIRAKINDSVQRAIKLPNLGSFDIFSKTYLWLLIKIIKPKLIICHGNRAINFAHFMKPQNIILIGVAHNYNIKWLIKCDYIIALTNHMEQHLLTTSFNKNNIAVIPNMILIKNNFTVKYYHKTIVIGTMARFVKKKGLHLFLNAIAILKSQKRNIRVIIGGDGPEKEHLINMAINLNLTKIISFIGFAHDKDKFFRDIDIFCLPSMHEPFGITVLEAMEHSTPIIATKTEGPSEILRDGQDGILCETNSCQDLIAKMVDLMNNQSKAQAYAASAYLRLQENYSLNKVSIILSEFIQKIST